VYPFGQFPRFFCDRPWHLAGLLAGFWLGSAFGQEAPNSLFFRFAEGRITCEVQASERSHLPGQLDALLPAAMKTALLTLPPPPEAAHLTIRLQAPPTFYKRLKALFRVQPSAIQQGDEISLQADVDPLKLAFRLGHEFSHWLTYKANAQRPPLWLDEGLANRIGSEAAAATARMQHLSLERTEHEGLADHLFSLAELTAMEVYPASLDASAAFYWQAEALVSTLLQRLGKEAFLDYLDTLSSSHPPDWETPLRETYYFNEGDIRWLTKQILPPSLRQP
jgi:hypothetical protein